MPESQYSMAVALRAAWGHRDAEMCSPGYDCAKEYFKPNLRGKIILL